jgi:lipopolysaccharide export system protein LptA
MLLRARPHRSDRHLRVFRVTPTFVAFVAASALSVAPIPVATADPLLAVGGEPMSVQAEKLEIDVSAGEATLTGNVSLSKGDLKVSCPRLELKFDTTPHVTWVRGSGGVSADIKGVHAEGPDVELDLAKHILELRGGVRLSRGQGWLQAERASIDTATAKVTLSQVKGSIPVPPKVP